MYKIDKKKRDIDLKTVHTAGENDESENSHLYNI